MVTLDIDVGTLTIMLIVMACFILLGRMAERSSHFIWPHDLFSTIVYIAAGGAIVLAVYVSEMSWLPLEMVIVALAAYIMGFVASGYRQYIHLLDIHAGTRSATMPYIVPYKVGNQWFLQIQTLKQHAKRVIFSIQAPIETNGDLRATWQWEARHPYFPIPALYCLPIEVMDLERSETVRKDRWIKCKQYNPLILLAPAAMCSKLDLVMTMQAHEQDVRANNDLSAELIRTKHQATRQAMSNITATVTRALYDDSPATQLYKLSQQQERSQAPPQELKKRMLRRRGNDGQGQ